MEGLTRFANALNLVQEAWSLYVEVSTADVDVESVANHVEWLSLRMAGWRSSLDQEALRGLVETEQEMLLGCLERLQLRIRNLVATLSNHQKGLQNKDASLAERLVRGVMWTHGERDSAKRMLDAITEEVELADKFFAGRRFELMFARLESGPRWNHGDQDSNDDNDLDQDGGEDSTDGPETASTYSSPTASSLPSSSLSASSSSSSGSMPRPTRAQSRIPRPPRMFPDSCKAMTLSFTSTAITCSPQQFVLDILKVGNDGQAWDDIREHNKFENDPASQAIFGLLATLMNASAESKWHKYTVQQWLKAGAFYLAMAHIRFSGTATTSDDKLRVYAILVKVFWITLCINKHPQRPVFYPDICDEPRQELTQYRNLLQGLFKAFDICNDCLNQAIPLLTFIEHVQDDLLASSRSGSAMEGSLWDMSSLIHISKVPTGSIALFGSRILEGIQTCSAHASASSRYSNLTETLCERAILILPRSHEFVPDPTMLLACVCGKHYLPYCVTESTEVSLLDRNDKRCVDIIRLRNVEDLQYCSLRLSCVDQLEAEKILLQVTTTVKAKINYQTIKTFEVSINEIPRSMRLARGAFDTLPPGAPLYERCKYSPAKEEERITEQVQKIQVSRHWVVDQIKEPEYKLQTSNVKTLLFLPAEWLPGQPDGGKDITIGSFCLELGKELNTTVIRLTNPQLAFEFRVPINERLFVIYLRSGKVLMRMGKKRDSSRSEDIFSPVMMTFIRAEGLMEFKRQYMFRRAFPLLLGPLDGIQEWRIRNKDVTNMKIIPRHQEDGTTWLALLSDGRNCLIFDTSNMTDVLVFQIRRESTEPTRDGFLKLRLPVRGRWCVRSIHDRRSSTPPDDTTQMATIQFAQPKACLKFRRAVEDNWGIILQQQIFRLKIYVKSTLRKKVLAEYKHDYIFLEIFEKYDSPWKRVVKVWVFNPNVVEEAPKRYEQRCDEKTRISFKKNTLYIKGVEFKEWHKLVIMQLKFPLKKHVRHAYRMLDPTITRERGADFD